MADIELRFGRDVMTLSAPIDQVLARQGVDAARDRQYLNLMEPDAIADALRLELLAGAQCLVTTTEDITRARLAHLRMDGDATRLAQAAAGIAADLRPQHILVEIGPTGLPLDASSKASLNESRAQYADAARAFENCSFDAFFLNGFGSIADMKCALMGVAQVSGKPIFASMTIAGQAEEDICEKPPKPAAAKGKGMPDEDATMFSLGYEPIDGPLTPAVPQPDARLDAGEWPDAIAAMLDLGASAIGFETADPLDAALGYVGAMASQTGLPLLAQLCIVPDAETLAKSRALTPMAERTDYALDTMELAAAKLYGAGVQFLRATGAATPAYTGALAAVVSGLDVRPQGRKG